MFEENSQDSTNLQDFEHMLYVILDTSASVMGSLLETRVTFNLTGIGGVLCQILAYCCNFIKKEISKFLAKTSGSLLGSGFPDFPPSSGSLVCITFQSHFHN